MPRRRACTTRRSIRYVDGSALFIVVLGGDLIATRHLSPIESFAAEAKRPLCATWLDPGEREAEAPRGGTAPIRPCRRICAENVQSRPAEQTSEPGGGQ
jgi:hypothetical protein